AAARGSTCSIRWDQCAAPAPSAVQASAPNGAKTTSAMAKAVALHSGPTARGRPRTLLTRSLVEGDLVDQQAGLLAMARDLRQRQRIGLHRTDRRLDQRIQHD